MLVRIFKRTAVAFVGIAGFSGLVLAAEWATKDEAQADGEKGCRVHQGTRAG
jgi:hypothetical protein